MICAISVSENRMDFSDESKVTGPRNFSRSRNLEFSARPSPVNRLISYVKSSSGGSAKCAAQLVQGTHSASFFHAFPHAFFFSMHLLLYYNTAVGYGLRSWPLGYFQTPTRAPLKNSTPTSLSHIMAEGLDDLEM